MLYAEEIVQQFNNREFNALRHLFRSLELADLAEIFEKLDVAQIILLLRLVPRVRRAELFAYLPFEVQEKLIDQLPDAVVTFVMNKMEADDRTQLLENLPTEIRSKIIANLSPGERRIAWKLLSYPEDSVGRLMNPDFLKLSADMSVTDAMAYIRWHHKTSDSLLQQIFVTDKIGKYLGEVNPSTLILADPLNIPIKDIMETTYFALSPQDDQVKAVDHFRKYDRTIMPVTDDKGTLIGSVTADDVFDVAEEEATEDIQQFGGQATLEDSYFETPLLTLLKKRAGWLSILFIGELFTGTALRHYDEGIASMRFLVYFLPLIISSGGNSGSQAASLIIRGIAIKEMAPRDWFRVFKREIISGLGLGLILGTMGYIRATTWGYTPDIGLSIFIALVSVVMLGAIAGSMLPFMFKAMKLDPAVSSSPFISVLVDLFGIVIFFEVAWAITHWWPKAVTP